MTRLLTGGCGSNAISHWYMNVKAARMWIKSAWWETALRTDVFAFDQWQGWEKGERGRINLSKTILICSLGSFSKYLNTCFRKLNMWVMAGLLLFLYKKLEFFLGFAPLLQLQEKKELQEKIYVESYTTYGQSQEKHFNECNFDSVKLLGENSDHSRCYFFFLFCILLCLHLKISEHFSVGH